MATRAYGINMSGSPETVIEYVGSATSSAFIVLTVDLSTSAVGEGGTTRTLLKSEVLQAITILQEYILKDDWPPA